MRKLFMVLLVLFALFVFINAYGGIDSNQPVGNESIHKAATELQS